MRQESWLGAIARCRGVTLDELWEDSEIYAEPRISRRAHVIEKEVFARRAVKSSVE